MAYAKLIQHDVLKERHNLTRLLKLEMYELKIAVEPEVINFHSSRMYGMVAAYWELRIINSRARVRYINLIGYNVIKRHREVNI